MASEVKHRDMERMSSSRCPEKPGQNMLGILDFDPQPNGSVVIKVNHIATDC